MSGDYDNGNYKLNNILVDNKNKLLEGFKFYINCADVKKLIILLETIKDKNTIRIDDKNNVQTHINVKTKNINTNIEYNDNIKFININQLKIKFNDAFSYINISDLIIELKDNNFHCDYLKKYSFKKN